MAKISLNEYELLMKQAADKMRELQEQKRDLLEACKALVHDAEQHFPVLKELDDSGTHAGLAASYLCAKAAIAKAEGKEQSNG